MKNSFLSSARKTLLKGNRLESIHILKENITDDNIIQQLQELEIRQNSLSQKNIAGTIDFEDVQMEENRISSAILSIINNLERKSKVDAALFPNNAKSKKGFDIKWLIIAVLVCGILGLGYMMLSQKGKEKDVPRDPCFGIECQNKGKCDNGRCKCPEGYTGLRCETKKAEDFKMKIEDVMSIAGRGTVVTGEIIAGEIKKGDLVKITFGGKDFRTSCEQIRASNKILNSAKKGDKVGLLLKGGDKGSLKRGMIITK